MGGGKKRKARPGRRSKDTAEEEKKPKAEPVSAAIEEEEEKKPELLVIRRNAHKFVRPTPPPVEPDTRLINIKVKAQDGKESSVRIKRCTQLHKLMTTFYEQENKEYGSVAFLYDGRGVGAHQTPQELDMDDGDEIDAMMHQSGGTTIYRLI